MIQNGNGNGNELSEVAGNETETSLQQVDMASVGGGPGVDIQVQTAKRYPRSISRFKNTALSMVQLDEETAAACIYAIPRGGKVIEGPSARLAEIVASAWGNLRITTRTTHEDARFIYSEAVAWDLETNVAICYSTRRRITNKYGKRFDDDMIGVTANAATSIALRNAVFKVVPMAYTKEIYKAARQTAAGDIKTLALRRTEMLKYFNTFGITDARLLKAIGKEKIDDINLDDLATLKGIATAIREGETSIDDAFPEIDERKQTTPDDSEKPKSGRLADKLANGNGQQKQEQEQPANEEPEPQPAKPQTKAPRPATSKPKQSEMSNLI